MTDPGLVRERTAVAWSRTALGAAGFGIALIRVGVWRASILEILAGALSLLGSAMLALSGRTVRRADAVRNTVAMLRSVTLAVVAIGGLAIVAALLG